MNHCIIHIVVVAVVALLLLLSMVIKMFYKCFCPQRIRRQSNCQAKPCHATYATYAMWICRSMRLLLPIYRFGKRKSRIRRIWPTIRKTHKIQLANKIIKLIGRIYQSANFNCICFILVFIDFLFVVVVIFCFGIRLDAFSLRAAVNSTII